MRKLYEIYPVFVCGRTIVRGRSMYDVVTIKSKNDETDINKKRLLLGLKLVIGIELAYYCTY